MSVIIKIDKGILFSLRQEKEKLRQSRIKAFEECYQDYQGTFVYFPEPKSWKFWKTKPKREKIPTLKEFKELKGDSYQTCLVWNYGSFSEHWKNYFAKMTPERKESWESSEKAFKTLITICSIFEDAELKYPATYTMEVDSYKSIKHLL